MLLGKIILRSSLIKAKGLFGSSIKISDEASLPQRTLFLSFKYSEYWEKTLGDVRDPKNLEIITDVLKLKSKMDTNVDHKQLNMRISKLVSFLPGPIFYPQRTVYDLVALMLAIKQSQIKSLMDHYYRIILILNRACNFDSLNSKMVQAMVEGLYTTMPQIMEKNRKSYYWLKINDIITSQGHKLSDETFIRYIPFFRHIRQQSNSSLVMQFRGQELFDEIQRRVYKILLEFQDPDCDQFRKKQIKAILNRSVLRDFQLSLQRMYFIHKEFATTYFSYITSDYIQSEGNIKPLVQTYCNLPYQQIEEKQGKIITVNDLFWQFLQKQFQNGKIKEKDLARLNGFHQRTFAKSYVHNAIYKAYLKLPFQSHEKTYLSLTYKDVSENIPQFCQRFWSIFKVVEDQLLYKPILLDFVKCLYPERVSQHQISVSTLEKLFLENEIGVRVSEALKILGYEFKSESRVGLRSTDFQVESEKLIIEIDGEPHFNFRTLEVNESTAVRNVYFIMRGYKLIVISNYEYNHNRESAQLAKLISKKIEILKSNSAAFVQ